MPKYLLSVTNTDLNYKRFWNGLPFHMPMDVYNINNQKDLDDAIATFKNNVKMKWQQVIHNSDIEIMALDEPKGIEIVESPTFIFKGFKQF